MVELFYATTHLKHSFMFAYEFYEKHNNNNSNEIFMTFFNNKKKIILHKNIKYVFHEITLWEMEAKCNNKKEVEKCTTNICF